MPRYFGFTETTMPLELLGLLLEVLLLLLLLPYAFYHELT